MNMSEPTIDALPGISGETPAEATQFGFRSVDPGEKQHLVNEVFHSVAGRYDLMNDLMSGGLHRIWKNVLVGMLRLPKRRFRHLDVAGGTGDIAFRILDSGTAETHVTVLDINHDMLEVGRERAAGARGGRYDGRIDFVEANAESLPFPDRSFDAYTIAFGIRNVPRMDRALEEAYRVLKTGGRLLILEFAPVDTPILDRAYKIFSFSVIPRLGRIVTGDGEPYRYLVESIATFPRPEAFLRRIGKAGFRRAEFRSLTGGIANIHSAWKL
jgi:demethylmenaquinone methyltransferase/2-methoxy-6-polyprenyl-1,4-benzoquinol methylase